MATLIRRIEDRPMAAQWEPFRLMRELMKWDPFAQMLPAAPAETGVYVTRFEVKETKDAYIFKADLPGIQEKDLDLSLTGDRLTVSGKREAEDVEESDTYYAYERSFGSFTRSFTLPAGADADHAEAELKNGVLSIHIPKRPEHQPKKISLKGIGEKVKGVLGGKEKGSA